jgi:NAD(P)-dependent dehydrogenase (short-subunit alcohol dehydrogenase family)
MKLEGRVTIVTGGASGLGAATAELFAASGAKVAIWDMSEAAGSALAAKLNGLFCKVDVSSQESVETALKATVAAYTRVDILVNSAGIADACMTVTRSGPHPLDRFERVMRINVFGTFNVSRYVAQQMASQTEVEGERGVIVNVASVAGVEGQRGQVAYASSKGAIIGMTLPLARDLASHKIRVNAILPGIFGTAMGEGMNPKVQKALQASALLGRLGVAAEFAHLAKRLVENTYMTGGNIRLDGGIRLPHI